MPRNGSGVYALPAVYNAVTGNTIQAAQHNTPLEDLQFDANFPRPVGAGGTGAANAAGARENLGLTIGTNVQAYDAGLQSIAGLTTAANLMIYTTGSDTYATTALTPFARTVLDDADATTMRTTIGANNAANLSAGTVPDARLPSNLVRKFSYGAPWPNFNGVDWNCIAQLDAEGTGVSNAPITAANWQLLSIGNSTRGMQITGQYNGYGLWVRKGADGWLTWDLVLTQNSYSSIAAGGLSTLAMLKTNTDDSYFPGNLAPGSALLYSSAAGVFTDAAPTGTWRCLCVVRGKTFGADAVGLWQRVA